MLRPPALRAAFTLIELSIVLVVVGLLVGGIVAGNSLLHASEIRGVVSQVSKYSSAVTQFKTEFNAYPGDLLTATTYWGSQNGSGSTVACYNDSKDTALTCNGNGSGGIDLTNPASAAVDCTETYLLWQHLRNAGLVEGKFNGRTRTLGSCVNLPGTNLPLGTVTGTTFTIYTANYNAAAGDTTFFEGYYGTVMSFGASASTGIDLAAGYTAEDMWNMDRKLDDGLPQTGSLRSYESMTNCYTGTEYNLMYKAPACVGLLSISATR